MRSSEHWTVFELIVRQITALFNKGIVGILSEIKKVSAVMSNDILKENRKHINNLLSLWNGMHWNIAANNSELIFLKWTCCKWSEIYFSLDIVGWV